MALTFRGNGGLGITGSAFIDAIRSPPFSISLTDHEGVHLVCEIMNAAPTSNMDSMRLCYNDVMTFFDIFTPSSETHGSESSIQNSIKRF